MKETKKPIRNGDGQLKDWRIFIAVLLFMNSLKRMFV